MSKSAEFVGKTSHPDGAILVQLDELTNFKRLQIFSSKMAHTTFSEGKCFCSVVQSAVCVAMQRFEDVDAWDDTGIDFKDFTRSV